MSYRLQQLGQYVRGWMGYFGISEYYRPVPELDEWLRRRVRMCYWKQWRGVRALRNLLRLGTCKKTAILTAISRRGYWHLSRSLATQTGIQRASLIRFARGDQSLRLDVADKLAAYFGLELQPTKARNAK